MNKIKLLTTLILGSVISCGDSMSMDDSIELPMNRWEAEDYCRQTFDMFPNTTDGFNGDFGGFAYSMGKLLESSDSKAALSFIAYSADMGNQSAVHALEVMLSQRRSPDDLTKLFMGKRKESFELILGGRFGEAVEEMKEALAYTSNQEDIKEIIGGAGNKNILFDLNQCIGLANRGNPYAMYRLTNAVITGEDSASSAFDALIDKGRFDKLRWIVKYGDPNNQLHQAALQHLIDKGRFDELRWIVTGGDPNNQLVQKAFDALIDNHCWEELEWIVINGDPNNQLVQNACKYLIDNHCWEQLERIVTEGNPDNQLHQDALNYLIDKGRFNKLRWIVKYGDPNNQLHQAALQHLIDNHCWEELESIVTGGNPNNQLHQKVFDAIVKGGDLYEIKVIANGSNLFAVQAREALAKVPQK